jgi:hypothetical protein
MYAFSVDFWRKMTRKNMNATETVSAASLRFLDDSSKGTELDGKIQNLLSAKYQLYCSSRII